MPYRKKFTGSPWQQGGPPFGMNQMGGGMGGSGFDGFGGGGPMGMGGMDSHFAMSMMGSGFGRNQNYGGYGGMGPMGMNMGYGMGNMSHMKDRRGNQQNFRNQRKRPIQSRSPMGNRNKRANYDISVNQRNRMRRRSRNNRVGGRNNYSRQSRNSSTGRRRRPEGQRSKDRDGDKDSESADGELYNPAEPTDDFSEYEYEDGDDMDDEQENEGEKEKESVDAETCSEKVETKDKTEKAEDDTEEKSKEEDKSDDKKDETDKSKNGIQVTIQHGAKGRSVSQEKKSGSSRKSLVCHVCKIFCSTQMKFRSHMNGRGHKEKMETLLVLQREKAQALEARMKASHHMRTDSSKSSGKGKRNQNQNWCTVCECAFVGNFLSHRRTKEHRKASMFHPSFRSQDSDDDYVIVDATGIFEDEDRKRHQDERSARAISEQLKDLMRAEPVEETPPEKTEEMKNTEEKKSEEKVEKKGEEKVEKKGEEKVEKKSEEKVEEKPVAMSAILLLNGYYCKLCYKFFGGGAPAKIDHCKNKRHIDNYKRSLPRPKKESTTEKDKAKDVEKPKNGNKTKEVDKDKETDKPKDGDKTKDVGDKTKNVDKDKETDKPKEEAGEPENKEEKVENTEVEKLEVKDEPSDNITQPELRVEQVEAVENMDAEDAENIDKNEAKETEKAPEENEVVQVTETPVKPDADVSMEADQSFVSAKDTEEESEPIEKEEDTEKSSPGVRRGRSARGRGRKRT